MNARGSTEVIIATIGLSMGALNQNLFTMIVAMAVITTMAMPPTLRWALSRIPLRKEEKQRLEREEQEEKGFVPNLERLLIAVDDSPNGKFASRVAGMLAGTHGMPTTVLHIKDASQDREARRRHQGSRMPPTQPTRKPAKEGRREEDRTAASRRKAERRRKATKRKPKAGDTVKQAAEQIKSKQKQEEKVDTPVEVTTIVHEAPSADVIAEEAEKGYDLMIIGLEKTIASRQGLPRKRDVAGAGLRGTAGDHRRARRSAEKAGRQAQHPGSGQRHRAVAPRGRSRHHHGARHQSARSRCSMSRVRAAGKASARRGLRTRRHEEAILKDIVAIADGYNMSIRTAVLADDAADDAILNEAERRKNNLIVMGVGRRPGEKLFFGDTAAALLADAECSLLFVAS